MGLHSVAMDLSNMPGRQNPDATAHPEPTHDTGPHPQRILARPERLPCMAMMSFPLRGLFGDVLQVYVTRPVAPALALSVHKGTALL